MAHHRDAGVDDRLRARDRCAAALELDRVGAAVLHEPNGVRHRLLVRGLVRAERHVGDDERPLRAARHPLRHEQDLVERDGHRRLAAVHDHAGRVADEDQVDAGGVGEPRARRVVGGDHDDLLAAAFHLVQLRAAGACPPSRTRSAEACRSCERSFQEDIVDQAGVADSDCGSEKRGAVELEDLDVVRSQAIQGTAGGGDCVAAVVVRLCSSRKSSREAERSLALSRRETRVARRRARGRPGRARSAAPGCRGRGSGRGPCGGSRVPAARPSGRSTRARGGRC